MPSKDSWFPGHLLELDRAECLQLLAGRVTGRIAYCDSGGPVVVPVNYEMHFGAVLIRIAPYSKLAQHLRDSPAAFEVDDFDDFNQSGWSVLVRGRAEYVDPDDLPDSDLRPQPWAEGHRTLYVRVTPSTITGRRLVAA
jgi:uncharacterized protein